MIEGFKFGLVLAALVHWGLLDSRMWLIVLLLAAFDREQRPSST